MVTAEEHRANLIANAFHREMEVYGYQVNVDNYSAMLADLPSDEWPAHVASYGDATIDSLPVSLSDEDVQLVADYQYRDRLRALLRSERVEQGKAGRVLAALKAQIGPDADVAIATYKAAQL